MPWQEVTKVDERAKFVLRLIDGERMSDLCREFNISRKTGYKIYNRFKNKSFEGLMDFKSGPKNPYNKTSSYLEKLIVDLKHERPTWGARKLHEYLKRTNPHVSIPAKNTIHNILVRNNLVKSKKRRATYKSVPTYLSTPQWPNDLWCIDYKGQFRMQNRKYCYPLTITDQVTRMIIACEGFESISTSKAIETCRNAFIEYGKPLAIRSDNGAPFASRSIWGLSKLSVWWLKNGVLVERIQPGKPSQNGRHERMHRTLKAETTRPAGTNLLNQQEMFDKFKYEYNVERPHEALGMGTPESVYRKSDKEFKEFIGDLHYPEADIERRVYASGNLEIDPSTSVFISKVFSGEVLGLTEVDDSIWEVKFKNYIMGYIDSDIKRLSVSIDPFKSAT